MMIIYIVIIVISDLYLNNISHDLISDEFRRVQLWLRWRLEVDYKWEWEKFSKKASLSPRFVENVRGLDDSRLLDAAETLVTLQTSGTELIFVVLILLYLFLNFLDLGSGSNNPLFSSTFGKNKF